MRNKGFTLAEVLITLSIIGVVAALTIPSVTHNVTEKQCLVALRKEYNVLTQATMLLQNSGVNIDPVSGVTAQAQYATVLKSVKSGVLSDFLSANNYHDYKSTNIRAIGGGAPALLMPDGSAWGFVTYTSGFCSTKHTDSGRCIKVFIDVNGNKSPNMVGKDYFAFVIANENGTWKAYPWGIDNVVDGNQRCSSTACAGNIDCFLSCTWNALQANSFDDMPP
jgi:prepilin-type N-terminal cleavage/methylation domain-containing protein